MKKGIFCYVRASFYNNKQEVLILIGILSTHIGDDEARLIERGQDLGHTVKALDVRKFGINIAADNPSIFYEGARIGSEYDAIIPRIDPPYTEFGFKVLRQFQAMGVYVTDTAYSLELARNKLRCMQYLMRKGVAFPKTAFAYSDDHFDDIIESVGGAPVVIKLNEGTGGVGVFLAEDSKTAKNFLGTFKSLKIEVMLQEFIAESAGTDCRVIVIGGKVIAALDRKSSDGDFRANIAQGGAYEVVTLTEEEEELALKAAEAMKLNIAGIDLIRSDNGPLIIEVNSALDFAGDNQAEDATGINISGPMIEYAVEGKKAFDESGQGWLD